MEIPGLHGSPPNQQVDPFFVHSKLSPTLIDSLLLTLSFSYRQALEAPIIISLQVFHE